MMLWQRHLEATAKANDPVLAPWHAFAALPREGFAAKAAEVQRSCWPPTQKDPKAAPVHPLVARVVLATAPAEHGRGRRAVRRASSASSRRGRRSKRPDAEHARRPCPSPSGSRSARRCTVRPAR